MVLNVNKPIGLTSYDVIRRLKKKYPGEKIGHAGTLDPLADGVLICLVGKEDTKRQSEYMGSEKEYEFEVLFGVNTDTYDILGLIMDGGAKYNVEELKERISENLHTGRFIQKVPPFSAVKINGKPLYRWYLEGKIDQVDIPSNEIEINEIELLEIQVIPTKNLITYINDLLEKVRNGFRQDAVFNSWNKFFDNEQLVREEYLLARFKAVVSKGTYIRAIAYELGKTLGTGACTTRITRTRVGNFKISEADLSY